MESHLTDLILAEYCKANNGSVSSLTDSEIRDIVLGMPITPPVTFGPLAMALSTSDESIAGSAPTRLMMAEMLFSPASSRAFSR